MKNIYNYKANITITTTATGDKVITMNSEILTSILNHIYDASEYQRGRKLDATADDTMELWKELKEKKDASEPKVQSDYSDIKWAIRRHSNLTDAERDLLIEQLKEEQ